MGLVKYTWTKFKAIRDHQQLKAKFCSTYSPCVIYSGACYFVFPKVKKIDEEAGEAEGHGKLEDDNKRPESWKVKIIKLGK